MKKMRTFLAFTLFTSTFCFSVDAVHNDSSMSSTQPSQEASKFYVYGDFLWWQTNADDVPLAVKEEIQSDNISFNNTVFTLKGKWDPGFRVGAGYHFGFYDELDLSLTYTRFHGESKYVSVTADNPNTPLLRQSWIPFLGPVVYSANGQWHANLDVGDIEIARKYQIGQHLSFCPHGGVRLAWVSFKYQANYTGVWINGAGNLVTYPSSVNASSYYNSGGLRGGSQFLWSFCENIGLLGDISASLLYGHFKIRERFKGADTIETGNILPVNEYFSKNSTGVRANFELLLGVQGSVDFYQDKCRFSLFAGYELSNWFRLNELFQLVRTMDSNNNYAFSTTYLSNDIGFQGLTVKAGLAF